MTNSSRNARSGRVFSQELSVVEETVSLASKQKMRGKRCKGCKCALLEAHFAELQTKRGQAAAHTHLTTTVTCFKRLLDLFGRDL